MFTPPPPLPGDADSARDQTTVSLAPAAAPDATKPPAAPRGDATTPSGDEIASSTQAFVKGELPPVGLGTDEIAAYNQAQGDPQPQGLALADAVAGIKGEGDLWIRFNTVRGGIECRLYERRTPLTVANFIALARGLRPVIDRADDTWASRRWYDGTLFHRVIPGFMIQGGDPTGTGTGSPGFVIPDEIAPDLRHDSAGMLSMANRGPGTGGAQFFITLAPVPHLDGKHTVFGRCSEAGLDIADDISLVPRDSADKPDVPEHVDSIDVYRRTADPVPSEMR
ncbi:MAG: peptidylprolyl isomerase [Nannocystaceae bacterium]